MTLLETSPDPDAPSPSEIEFLRWKQEQTSQRNKFVAFTHRLMTEVLLEKATVSGLMLKMLFTGHGCACDTTGVCAAHAGAYNLLLEAYNALEAAVTELHQAADGKTR